MQRLSQKLDRVEIAFDDDHAVAEAGLILPATLTGKLDIEQSADELISVGYRPGRKLTTLVHALLAGAQCIDDIDILRSGTTGRILNHKVMSPLDVGYVAAFFHLRSRTPARQARCRDPKPRLDSRCGTSPGANDHRPGLHHL